MSRGAGRVMRELEHRLSGWPTPLVVLARDIYAVDEPTRAQIESVRRAAKRLRDLGRARTPRGCVRRLRTEAEIEEIRQNRIRHGLPPTRPDQPDMR